jgi:ATP-dependent phosphofructokinase / diphosphate-dependent phosphofructokinase
MTQKSRDMVGIIVGGGPAPGINGVISSATIEASNSGKQVIGIKGGFKALFDGDKNCGIPLTIDTVSRIHNKGGSILRTSRDFPDKAKEKFPVLLSTLKHLGIRYLVSIGGDGSLFMSNWIEKESRGDLSVVHVPKTIDNDVPLPGNQSTFGYQTARHWGVEIVENIMEDAKTTGRWYFVSTMGRNAGFLALGIAKAAGATVTVIAEELKDSPNPLQKAADILTGSILKRLSMRRDHGVAILAEGISGICAPEELAKYDQYGLDETGRIRLSDIQLGRVIKNFVKKNLSDLGVEVTIVDKVIGYELRAADPIPYDVEYTRDLGYGAVRYLLKGGTGAMIVFDEGYLKPIPFVELFDFRTGKVKVRRVDITSESYEVARKYMIRLGKEDFEGDNLRKIAQLTNLTPEEFANRFSYLD